MRFHRFISSVFLTSSLILHSKSKNIITEEDLNKFYYGQDEFSLAVIGDSGTEKAAKQVMELSKFDALLHLGDYDYKCIPDKYFTDILDKDRKYQFMGVLGNHDAKGQCSDKVAERFKENIYNEMKSSRNSKTHCEFSESKFMWVCIYKNMRIIGLTAAISGADDRKEQLKFLKKHLNDATEDWKICSWHFYDKYYHTGMYQEYGNIVSGDHGGESFYDYCKDHGAIIFSAHDHVYARTKVMSEFKEPVIDKYDGKTSGNIVQIRNGATFNILNGAGGWEMYIEKGEQKDYKHWEKKYARGDNYENANRYGGLFCQFNVGGNKRKAYCEFQRINSSDKVFDKFYIYRNDDPENHSYNDIDESFISEKIKAFEIENNISNESTNVNDNNDDDISNNKEINSQNSTDNQKSTNNQNNNNNNQETFNNKNNDNNQETSNNQNISNSQETSNNQNSSSSQESNSGNNSLLKANQSTYNENKSKGNIQSSSEEDKNIFKKVFSTTNIIIVGSVAAVAALSIGGLLVHKKKRNLNDNNHYN